MIQRKRSQDTETVIMIMDTTHHLMSMEVQVDQMMTTFSELSLNRLRKAPQY